MDLIEKSGMKLIHTVEELLELSRIASGQIQINPQKCNPFEIMEEQFMAINKMLQLNPKKGFEVRFDSVDGGIAIIPQCSDVVLIKKVLNILTDNALKFTEMGQIVLGIKLADENIIFYVADTGIGIPEEKQESIVEPFVQVDLSMRRPTKAWVSG